MVSTACPLAPHVSGVTWLKGFAVSWIALKAVIGAALAGGAAAVGIGVKAVNQAAYFEQTKVALSGKHCCIDRRRGCGNIHSMSATLEDIARNALQLPSRQRLVLAGLLLEIDDATSDQEVEATWEQEIQARIMAVDSGCVAGISYHDVMSEAEKRLVS